MKQYTTKALLIASVALTSLLAGCGGESPAAEQGDKLAENVERLRETMQLPGLDKNKNGIRDDIEPWVSQKSLGLSNEFRSALSAIAISEQRMILAEEASQAEGAHGLYNLAASCLFFLEETKGTPNTFALLQDIRGQMLDTGMRQERHEQARGMLHDSTMTLNSGSDAWSICLKLSVN